MKLLLTALVLGLMIMAACVDVPGSPNAIERKSPECNWNYYIDNTTCHYRYVMDSRGNNYGLSDCENGFQYEAVQDVKSEWKCE